MSGGHLAPRGRNVRLVSALVDQQFVIQAHPGHTRFAQSGDPPLNSNAFERVTIDWSVIFLVDWRRHNAHDRKTSV